MTTPINNAGLCAKCGAPYIATPMWRGTVQPPMTPTCECWNLPMTVTGTVTGSMIGVPGVAYSADYAEGLAAGRAEREAEVERLREALEKIAADGEDDQLEYRTLNRPGMISVARAALEGK